LISSSVTNVQEDVQVVIVDITTPEQKSNGCPKDLRKNGLAVGEGPVMGFINVYIHLYDMNLEYDMFGASVPRSVDRFFRHCSTNKSNQINESID